jgi:SAM-dependent methyltransferase
MSFSDASKVRYSTKHQQASYLEAEWSDYLYGCNVDNKDNIDPNIKKVFPTFYLNIASQLEEWLVKLNTPAIKYCDVGGATGRMLYEIYQRIDSIKELVLVEPSSELAQWAEFLLFKPEQIDWIPVLHDCQKCRYARPVARPEKIESENRNIYICNVSSDDIPRPQEYFDIISCLNVVDRVASPSLLLESLYYHLAPGGLLLLSSPLAFDERFTPDRRQWIIDLNELFDERTWESIGETEIIYDFRKYRREWNRYSSQVVAMKKRTIK